MGAFSRWRRRPGPGAAPAAIAWLGLLPLVALAILVAAGGAGGLDAAEAARLLAAYGAVTLGFLGGIRWGLAMRISQKGGEVAVLLASVLPMLIGFAALLAPPAGGLALLAAGFAGQGAWDVWSIEAGGGPTWYGRLRLRVTAVAAVALAGALIALGA